MFLFGFSCIEVSFYFLQDGFCPFTSGFAVKLELFHLEQKCLLIIHFLSYRKFFVAQKNNTLEKLSFKTQIPIFPNALYVSIINADIMMDRRA